MSAGKHNITIDQGADFAMQLTLSENAVATDLTGYYVRAQLRKKKTSTAVTATFTCTVVGDPTNGIINIAMVNGITAPISPGRYYYDIEIYTASDVIVLRILEGSAEVTAEVTR